MHRAAPHRNATQHNATPCNAMRCTSLQCNPMQYAHAANTPRKARARTSFDCVCLQMPHTKYTHAHILYTACVLQMPRTPTRARTRPLRRRLCCPVPHTPAQSHPPSLRLLLCCSLPHAPPNGTRVHALRVPMPRTPDTHTRAPLDCVVAPNAALAKHARPL